MSDKPDKRALNKTEKGRQYAKEIQEKNRRLAKKRESSNNQNNQQLVIPYRDNQLLTDITNAIPSYIFSLSQHLNQVNLDTLRYHYPEPIINLNNFNIFNNNLGYMNEFNLVSSSDTSPQKSLIPILNQPFNLPNLVSSTSEMPDPKTKITMKDILASPHNFDIILPEDPTEIVSAIDDWITELSLFEFADEAKTFLLKSALKKSRFVDLFKECLKLNSYDAVYGKIKDKVAQEDVKIIFSPTKKKPLEAFVVIDRIFDKLPLESKLSYLNKHLDKQTINNLILNCDTSDDVKKQINKLKLIDQDSKDYKIDKLNEIVDQQSQILNKLINQNREVNHISNKNIEQRLEKIENQLNQLMSKTQTRSRIKNGICKFHLKFGDKSFTCLPGCSRFDDKIYTIHIRKLNAYGDPSKMTNSGTSTPIAQTNVVDMMELVKRLDEMQSAIKDISKNE